MELPALRDIDHTIPIGTLRRAKGMLTLLTIQIWKDRRALPGQERRRPLGLTAAYGGGTPMYFVA